VHHFNNKEYILANFATKLTFGKLILNDDYILKFPLLDFVPCHQLDIWERGETLGKFMEISLFINLHM